MFSLARFIEQTAAGRDPVFKDPITQGQMRAIAPKVVASFRKTWAEFLSAYNPEKLWELLSMQQEEEPWKDAELTAAITHGDTEQAMHLMREQLERALFVLFANPRSALHRIALFETLPQEAAAQLHVLSQKFSRIAVVAPEEAPVTAVVLPAPISPEDECLNDWKNLGSSVFKAKWMDSRTRRQVYDRVVASGAL